VINALPSGDEGVGDRGGKTVEREREREIVGRCKHGKMLLLVRLT